MTPLPVPENLDEKPNDFFRGFVPEQNVVSLVQILRHVSDVVVVCSTARTGNNVMFGKVLLTFSHDFLLTTLSDRRK